jgi:hypothetical protein
MGAVPQRAQWRAARAPILASLLGVAWLAGAPAAAGAEEALPRPSEARLEAYRARRPKSVIDLQLFRTTTRVEISDGAGARGTASLIDLNPYLHAWFLLQLEWEGRSRGVPYHLENPYPGRQRVALDAGFREGLVLSNGDQKLRCDLWSTASAMPLAAARASQRVYAPLCQGRLYLRNPAVGHKTPLEWTTDFLRDYVWEGEKISNFVRKTFFQDAFLEAGRLVPGRASEAREAGAPAPARVDAAHRGKLLNASEFGIALEGAGGQLEVGRWYAVRGIPGVFASTLRPDLVAREVVLAEGSRVSALDGVESSALVYAVAFDLDSFEVGFAMGTDHPRVGWSDRVRIEMRDPALPGPDGFDTLAPLVMTGMLNPTQLRRVIATFAGGFKRRHGGFRHSELAKRNFGSHYGFLESGVILSKLQPGLATLAVWDDGGVDLRTWTEADDAELWHLRHARQNGVPIVEPDPQTGATRPGALVRSWGAGNWSGSQDDRFRTLRAGVCLQESDAGRFLVYGYFSSVTPSAMARVFEAYGCRYAMHLDMNALEHTYLALYRRQQGGLDVEHLIRGMDVLDKKEGDRVVPRFLGFPDNRDFFYLLKREGT